MSIFTKRYLSAHAQDLTKKNFWVLFSEMYRTHANIVKNQKDIVNRISWNLSTMKDKQKYKYVMHIFIFNKSLGIHCKLIKLKSL